MDDQKNKTPDSYFTRQLPVFGKFETVHDTCEYAFQQIMPMTLAWSVEGGSSGTGTLFEKSYRRE